MADSCSVQVDATLLSRGMMFVRRKKAEESSHDHPVARGGPEPCLEDDHSDMEEFSEYVGRDIVVDMPPPEAFPSSASSDMLCFSEGTVAERRGRMQRRTSVLFAKDEELRKAVDYLIQLGDEIDDQVKAEMRAAVETLTDDGDVEADELKYDDYKNAAAGFVKNGEEEWTSVAKLFRFGNEVLSASEGNMGEGMGDVRLEQVVEDYNSKVMVDLMSAFISRAGGILGLVG